MSEASKDKKTPQQKLEEMQDDMALNGHGHIYPRADGERLCGGVVLCDKCFREGKSYANALHWVAIF